MQIHQIKPIHKTKKKKRVGRGGKKGDYSGRGVKGQKSRSGTRKGQPMIREIIKRYPKLRGYRFNPKSKIQNPKVVILDTGVLEKNFASGEKITPKILLSKGIISKIKGKVPEVKILGKGEVSKKLVIEGCEASEGAIKKIEKAGGKVKSF